MTTPRKWTPAEPITAERLNVSQAEASRSRRDIFLGDGSSMVNEQMGNQSANMRRPQIKLVVALEDFGIPETPTDIPGAVDDVPSGLVREVRLGRITSTHQDDVSSVKFLAYDPAGWLSGKVCTGGSDSASASASTSTSGSDPAAVSTKSECDVFHVVYNVDSKRWEALGGAVGSLRIVYGITRVCLADGWYEIEITDWAEEPPIDSNSLSSSVSASVSDDPCDVCALDEQAEIDTTCESMGDVEVTRPTGTPTGEMVYGHTAETLPLAIGGLVKMIKRVTPAASGSVSTSVSTSVSDTPITDLYDIVDSQKPLISLPFPEYECCSLPGGGQEVRLVQCNRAIVAGVICVGPYTPCPASDSASASESV